MGHIKTDIFQKTNIVGIYACADNTSIMRTVSFAVLTGCIAGSMINKGLGDEAF